MGELVLTKNQEVMSPGDIEVLRNSKFKGFTDAEISFARQVSSHLQLNPLLNQVHFVKRKAKDGKDTITTQVGIDGFRLIAERTGNYAGSDEPIFEGNDKYPKKATVTVYKLLGGQRCAFTASALWAEYFPGEGNKDSFMWVKMPRGQLGKCAETLALRKAFPAELSAIRSDEEMAQAENEASVSKAKSLNARLPAVAQVVDAVVVEEPAKQPEPVAVEAAKPVSEAPQCCGRKTMVSKFPNREGERAGKIDFYCTTCKTSYPREQ